MSGQAYDGYQSKPFEDIKRADELLNKGVCHANDVALAAALCQLAQAKMMGRGRA